MPVQIDELIITATVDLQSTSNGAATSGLSMSNISDEDMAERVLQIIREKTER